MFSLMSPLTKAFPLRIGAPLNPKYLLHDCPYFQEKLRICSFFSSDSDANTNILNKLRLLEKLKSVSDQHHISKKQKTSTVEPPYHITSPLNQALLRQEKLNPKKIEAVDGLPSNGLSNDSEAIRSSFDPRELSLEEQLTKYLNQDTKQARFSVQQSPDPISSQPLLSSAKKPPVDDLLGSLPVVDAIKLKIESIDITGKTSMFFSPSLTDIDQSLDPEMFPISEKFQDQLQRVAYKPLQPGAGNHGLGFKQGSIKDWNAFASSFFFSVASSAGSRLIRPFSSSIALLGDNLISLFFAEFLSKHHPNFPRLRAVHLKLISNSAFEEAAHRHFSGSILPLLRFTSIDRGKPMSASDSVQKNPTNFSSTLRNLTKEEKTTVFGSVVESIIGRLYLEEGLESARAWAEKLLIPSYKNEDEARQQARIWLSSLVYPNLPNLSQLFKRQMRYWGYPYPKFEFIGTRGELQSTMVMGVLVGDQIVEEGIGASKSAASRRAGENAAALLFTSTKRLESSPFPKDFERPKVEELWKTIGADSPIWKITKSVIPLVSPPPIKEKK